MSFLGNNCYLIFKMFHLFLTQPKTLTRDIDKMGLKTLAEISCL